MTMTALPPAARRSRLPVGPIVMVTVGLLVAFLALYPIAWLLVGSFRTGTPFEVGHFTFANYIDAYGEPNILRTIKNTLVFAAGQTMGAIALGTLLAWIITRTNTPGRAVFEFLTLVLFLFPLIMAVFAWTMLLSPRRGLINIVLMWALGLETPPFDVNSMGGMIFVQSLYVAPLAFLIIAPAFATMDSSMEEAARMTGARTLRILRRITLPLALPAIASASVLLFVIGLESFDIPQMLGAPKGIYTYPSLIYHAIGVRVPADYGLGTALATSLLGATLLLVYLYRRLTRRTERYETVKGKGHRAAVTDLGPWRWVSAVGCWVFFFFTVFLPFGVLVLGSFLGFFGRFSWAMFNRLTLDNYPRLFAHPRLIDAMINSLGLAAIGGAVCVLLAAIVGFIAIKSKLRGRGLIEAVAMLPISFPSTVLGLALLWAWIVVPLPIYGTVLILAVAYITRYLPVALRTVSGGLIQMSNEFEEAARMTGAGWLTIFTRIILPLMKPALAAAWLLMFMTFVRELGMSILLVGRGNAVLSVVMFDYYTSGEQGLLAAASVLLMLMILSVVIVARQVFRIRFSQFGSAA